MNPAMKQVCCGNCNTFHPQGECTKVLGKHGIYRWACPKCRDKRPETTKKAARSCGPRPSSVRADARQVIRRRLREVLAEPRTFPQIRELMGPKLTATYAVGIVLSEMVRDGEIKCRYPRKFFEAWPLYGTGDLKHLANPKRDGA